LLRVSLAPLASKQPISLFHALSEQLLSPSLISFASQAFLFPYSK
jgi:hypothetical protein